MDHFKENLTDKLISIVYIVLSVLLGSAVSWANEEIGGQRTTPKAKAIVFAGSIGLAFAVHAFCVNVNYFKRWEWFIMWGVGVFTVRIIKYIYTEGWPMVVRGFQSLLVYMLDRVSSFTKKNDKQ